jgi:long-chain acyl-CoA synthetase
VVDGVAARMQNASSLKRVLYRSARAAGRSAANGRMEGRVTTRTRLRGAWWSLLVDGPLRDKLGVSRLRAGLSSGDVLDADRLTALWGLDVPVFPVLSQPESGGLSAANVPGAVRAGTFGRAVPGVTVQVDGQGQLVVRGSSILPVLDGDGRTDLDEWQPTGYVGSIDADGFVRPEADGSPIEVRP